MATKAKKLPYCIIRCRDAGVHAGELISRKGREVKLRNSRRLWRWWSRFSLSELALEGPRKDKISECRFAASIPSIELLEVCEVIPCSRSAEKSIKAVPDAIK
jgi:hypothetical protein